MRSARLQTRRKLIATFGTAAVVGLAGCADNGETSGDDQTDEEQASTGAETAVEAFISAQKEFDQEAVQAVIHPESPFSYPGADGDFPHEDELTINDITEISTETYLSEAEGIDDETLSDEVAETESDWDGRIEQIGATDYAFVRASTTADGEDDQTYYYTVEDDSEWFLF